MSRPSGSGDRSCFRFDVDAREVGGIAERLEHSSPFASDEVDVTDGAVGKDEAQADRL